MQFSYSQYNLTSQEYAKMLMGQFVDQSGSYEMQAWFSKGMSAWTYADMWSNGNGAQRNMGQRGIFMMCADFLMGRAQKAEKEVDQSSDNIDNAKKRGEEIGKATSEEVDEILVAIGDDIESIEAAIEKIEEIGGTQLESIKEQLNTQKEAIEEQIEIIREAQNSNNPDAKDTIQTALNQITTIQGTIASLLGEFSGLTDGILAEEDKVEEAANSIVEQQSKAEAKIAEGINKVEGVKATVTSEGQYNVTYIKNGAAEEEQALVLDAEAAGAATATFGVGAAVAEKAAEKAIDLHEASATHIKGGSDNLKSLGSALGELGTDMKDISAYSTAVGSKLETANTLIGQFEAKANEYITSIGSLEQSVNTTNKIITSAVDNDLTNIDCESGVVAQFNEEEEPDDDPAEVDLKNIEFQTLSLDLNALKKA